jgi:hypothetical protein
VVEVAEGEEEVDVVDEVEVVEEVVVEDEAEGEVDAMVETGIETRRRLLVCPLL